MSQAENTTQLSQGVFDGVNWLFFSLSLIALATRLYIRITVFRRLIVEDYLMLAMLCLMVADEALGQRYSGTIYWFMGITNGTRSYGDDLAGFLSAASSMLKALGSAIIFFLVALYVIKANFMFFFRRLGERASRRFHIVWWVSFAVLMACGVVSLCLGVTTYKCLFNGIVYTLTKCESAGEQNNYFTYFKVTVALDIITDAIIIGFPIWLLWGVRITLRQKLVLGAIFSLVGVTIVATILRGAILTTVFEESASGKTINIPWIWFWFHIELCISVIVACLVSFRSLFMQREHASNSDLAQRRAAALQRRPSGYNPGGNSSERTPQQSGNASRRNLTGAAGGGGGGGGMRGQMKLWQDSIFDACRTLEGLDFEDGVTLVDNRSNEHELSQVAGHDRDIEAGHGVPDRSQLRSPSIDSLLVVEESAQSPKQPLGRSGTRATVGSVGSSQRRPLSIDSLNQPSDEETVSSVSSADERRAPSR